MDNPALDNLEIASPSVIRQAAGDFAAALSETSEFKAFEQATYKLRHDPDAAQAQKVFQARQASLKALIQLRAVPPEDQAELERLAQAYNHLPVVVEYQQAEAKLRALCQVLNQLLSEPLGLDFAAASSSGCCG